MSVAATALSRLKALAPRALPGLVLAAACFAVYANNYTHAYHLDDAYTLLNNTSVRSLDAVPRYFVDPGTYTSLREQADYRPLLQVTYALNHALGGYATPWWHFTQVLLHALVAIGIYAFARRVLELSATPPAHPERYALVGALLFAVHPAASGVVNYFNARSSLLAAAFLLPALIAFMRDGGDDRPRWGAAAWLALALFTKVEAVGALGAMLAFELWRRARARPGIALTFALRATIDRATLRRLAPALAVTAAYFVIRAIVMAPFPFDETRHAADVGAYEYFLTQVTAWWHYVARWLAPLHLVADDLAYPVRRSLADPVVLLALGGWGLVATLLVATFRRAPEFTFLCIAALALLSPTSSVAPLAEMVNEHRPYLPVGLLFAGLIAAGAHHLRGAFGALSRTLRAGSILAGGVTLAALSLLTWQRNLVFRTPASYWRDVLDKAPSSRAHLNYGLALAGANDLPGALSHYREALRLAPHWYYTHINLGVMHARLGQPDSARFWYDRAVDNDRYSGHALVWRGEFRLAQRDYAGARSDFEQSAALSLQPYRNAKGLATAFAGLGDVDRSIDATLRLIAIDSAAALVDVPGISLPFFENPALRRAGIAYYRTLGEHVRGTWWIPENITRLERLLTTASR